MTFADPGYAFQSLLAHELRTEVSMHQIGGLSMAMYPRRIRKEYAYIMKHGTLFDQLTVERHLGMRIHDVQRTLHHLTAMVHQQTVQVVVCRIVFLDELKSFH